MSLNFSSTVDPNRFVAVFNTFKQDAQNGLVLGLDNLFLVPQIYGTVQEAVDVALAKGHDQWDPAIISITPDSSTGTSSTDVQFTEDITLYDGIYLVSAVPNKRVNINGTLRFGSTALGTDAAGVANTNLLYVLQDMHFCVNRATAAAICLASTAVVTRLDMTRVDLTVLASGTSTASDVCMTISALAVWTVNMDRCVFNNNSSIAGNYALQVSAVAIAHVVNMNNQCVMNVRPTGAATLNTNALIIDNGAVVTANNSRIEGGIQLFGTAASTLSLYGCRVVGNVATNLGLIQNLAGANNINLYDTTFEPVATQVNIITATAGTYILFGANCMWKSTVAFGNIVSATGFSGSSRWNGPPIPILAGAPAASLAPIGSLFADSAAAHAVKQIVV